MVVTKLTTFMFVRILLSTTPMLSYCRSMTHLLNKYTTIQSILDLDSLDNLQVAYLISEIDLKLDKK